MQDQLTIQEAIQEHQMVLSTEAPHRQASITEAQPIPTEVPTLLTIEVTQ